MYAVVNGNTAKLEMIFNFLERFELWLLGDCGDSRSSMVTLPSYLCITERIKAENKIAVERSEDLRCREHQQSLVKGNPGRRVNAYALPNELSPSNQRPKLGKTSREN